MLFLNLIILTIPCHYFDHTYFLTWFQINHEYVIEQNLITL